MEQYNLLKMYFKLSLSKRILFTIFLLILFFILIYNILHYDPILGYDAEAHYSYIDTFSRYLPRSIHLPTDVESREFFSPPLPYLFPSAIQVLCRNISSNENLLSYCQPVYGKYTQIFQNILFLVSIFINLKTLSKFKPNKSLNLSFLVLTMLLAVNYRTVSIIKGEIYILFFLSLMINIFSNMETKNFKYDAKDILKFGFVIGCLALTRQWVFLIFPSFILIYFKLKRNNKNYFKFISYSFLTGFVLSGWFYINNLIKYGSLTAFNTKRNTNISGNDLIEYISLKNINEFLFTNPIRPHFNKQFFPIFYSDTWGDYWGYFSFTSRFLDIGREQLTIGSYLGRVNAVSILSTIIILVFYIKTIRTHKSSLTITLLNYGIIFSIIGYFVWVILYQTGSQGDTIKATYMTQALNLVVFTSAISFENLKDKKRYFGLILIIGIILGHNFQSYLSHFPMFYP